MRKQWVKFLQENQSDWSYGIVPQLAKRLEKALKAGDVDAIGEALEGLELQGVTVDRWGNLRFLAEIGYR